MKLLKIIKSLLAVFLLSFIVFSLSYFTNQIIELKKEVIELKEAIPSMIPTPIPSPLVVEPTIKPSTSQVGWESEEAQKKIASFRKVAIEKGFSKEAINEFLEKAKATGLSPEEFSKRLKESQTLNVLENIAQKLQGIEKDTSDDWDDFNINQKLDKIQRKLDYGY